MGKQTLYHPVPLSVIRGAVEYCSFKFGRIEQKKSAEQSGYAIYQAQVVKFAPGAENISVRQLHRVLQNCFNEEVVVLNVLINQRLWCRVRLGVSKVESWQKHFMQTAFPETIPF